MQMRRHYSTNECRTKPLNSREISVLGGKVQITDNCSFVNKLHGHRQTEASYNWEVWEAKVLQGGATSAL